MDTRAIAVLLLVRHARGYSRLHQWLSHRGCNCQVATTCKQACSLISHSKYDLVLSEYELPEETTYPLLKQLIGSSATLFLAVTAGNGCLWVPALLYGRRWPEAHVLRQEEFSGTLDRVLKKLRSDRAAAEEAARTTAHAEKESGLVGAVPARGRDSNRMTTRTVAFARSLADGRVTQSAMTNVLSKDTNGPLSERQLDFSISNGTRRSTALARIETWQREAVVP